MTRDEIIETMARAICLYQFGDIETHGSARCCQVGGVHGCCIGEVEGVAICALSALEAKGLRLVPEEPTPEMTRAGDLCGFSATVRTITADIYRAMLAAFLAETKAP